jgi:hypothetical protein
MVMLQTKIMDPTSQGSCPTCSINAEVAVVRIPEYVPDAQAQANFEGVMQAIEERLPQVYDACLFSETVATRFGQLYIVSPGCDYLAPELAFEGQRNGLCGGAVEGGLFLAVGMHAGEVALSVEICASPPHHLHGDEIVEVSCTFFGPHAYLKGWGGEILAKLPLLAGQYRARYTASDFGDAPGRFKDRPIKESYSVVLWPEPPCPDSIVLRSAQAAAYWHKLMQKRHFPLEPKKLPTQPRPAVVFDSHMHTCYGIFTVLSRNCHELQPHEAMAGQANGICGGAVAGGLFLTVGLHTGNVRIAVELHDYAPPIDPSWDEIVEAPCNFTALPVCLNSWDGGGIALPLDDGGEYRARFCAKSFGKTDSQRPHGGETDECYRLFLWPEARRPDVVIKQTSEAAAYWHSHMGQSA